MKRSIVFILSTLTVSVSLHAMKSTFLEQAQIYISEACKREYPRSFANTRKETAWKLIGRTVIQETKESIIAEIIPDKTAAHVVAGTIDGAQQAFCNSTFFGPQKSFTLDTISGGAQRGAFVFGGEMLILVGKELLECIEQASKSKETPDPVQNIYAQITRTKKSVSEYHKLLEKEYPIPTKMVTSLGYKITRDLAAYTAYALMCKAGGGTGKASSFYSLAGYGL